MSDPIKDIRLNGATVVSGLDILIGMPVSQMWRLPRALPVMLVGLVLAAGAGAVRAQAQAPSMEERLRTQLRATTAQLQQVQNELAALKASGGASGTAQAAKPDPAQAADKAGHNAAEVAALKRELSQARAALAQEQEARARQEQQSGERQRGAQEAAERSSAQVLQFRAAYNEVLRVARSTEAERARLAAGVQAQEQALAQCDLKNQALYRVGQDILQAYETLDTRNVLEARHLFAAKARVKYDEVAQRYGDQLYAARFDPANSQGQPATDAATTEQRPTEQRSIEQRPTEQRPTEQRPTTQRPSGPEGR